MGKSAEILDDIAEAVVDVLGGEVVKINPCIVFEDGEVRIQSELSPLDGCVVLYDSDSLCDNVWFADEVPTNREDCVEIVRQWVEDDKELHDTLRKNLVE